MTQAVYALFKARTFDSQDVLPRDLDAATCYYASDNSSNPSSSLTEAQRGLRIYGLLFLKKSLVKPTLKIWKSLPKYIRKNVNSFDII